MRFSQIAPADVPLPKAGNRFDVPGGAVFEGTTVRELARRPILRTNLAMQGVAATWGLNVF